MIILFILAHLVSKTLTNEPCNLRSYGTNHKICVCNSTYCDTISPIKKINLTNYILYTSNKAGLRFSKTQGTFNQTPDSPNHVIAIGDTEYQEIYGFGGAFTDAVGINILSLPVAAQEKLMSSYFGANGIEYTFGRVPIGCSDFSVHGYTYDDSPTPDPDLKNFNLTIEDYLYKIPFIKEAIRLSNNHLKLIGVAWTSPKWMKVIPSYSTMFSELKRKMFQPWAQYHLRFLEEYDKNNIKFWGLSTGNEPSIGYTPIAIPSVSFTASLLSKWVAENLGPTIRSSKYSRIKILTLEDERTFLPWFIDDMFKNEATENFIDGITLHYYFDKIAPPVVLDLTHGEYPDKFLLSTEACRGQVPFEPDVLLGSWTRGEDIAQGIFDNLNHWVTGWIDWNMALDEQGGPSFTNNYVDAPIIVNKTAGEFYKQPMFYIMGHFSKFVPPGSIRIKISRTPASIKVMGFKRPDGGISIVLLNTNSYEVNVNIIDKSNGRIPLQLSAHSISSLVYWK